MVLSRHVAPTRLAAAVSADTAAESTTTADLKKTLLRAVGNEDRSERDILDAAAALEALDVRTAPVSGRWALVFSTQTARPKESAATSIMDLPHVVGTKAINFPTFFKHAGVSSTSNNLDGICVSTLYVLRSTPPYETRVRVRVGRESG